MTQLDLTGVFPALVTPFDTRTAIDHAQLRAEVRRLEDAGVAGVVPAGSTGESATLSHDEHIEVIETVVDAVESIPVIAGTGSNSTDEALELSRRAPTGRLQRTGAHRLEHQPRDRQHAGDPPEHRGLQGRQWRRRADQ
jgi:dihydrodipicolinate synthase/N-acetylneuraminate lyase